MIERGDYAAGAVFSECDRYRYQLWRRWGQGKTVAFCMLNPSTADEKANDPTIERCCRRAKAWGFDGVDIVNLFALRSTDPAALYRVGDPVGPHNFEAIVQTVKRAEFMVCAWGRHGKHCGMGETIMLRMRQFYPEKLRILKLNKDGQPAHPLYLPYSLQPVACLDPCHPVGT